MPIGRYCSALRTWEQALVAKVDRELEALHPGLDGKSGKGAEELANITFYKEYKAGRHPRSLAQLEQVTDTFRMIRKSNLLARLLYAGETLRTVPCPEHKGKWSGVGDCKHGCQLTGWLPEKANPVVVILP